MHEGKSKAQVVFVIKDSLAALETICCLTQCEATIAAAAYSATALRAAHGCWPAHVPVLCSILHRTASILYRTAGVMGKRASKQTGAIEIRAGAGHVALPPSSM